MVYINIVQKVFNEKIYPELKEYVETNSIYEPLVTKVNPNISKVFPIIPVKLLPYKNTYNNLSYGEETYRFGIEIDINSQDKQIDNKQVSKNTINEEIIDLIIDYFKTNYRVSITVNSNAVNLDERVKRSIIRVSGVIDTKYGLDKLVIYPKLK